MAVTLLLEQADQGWHVRWRSSDTEAFEQTREAFKAILPLSDRYWDPDAFEGRGGWWVSSSSLDLVAHLFLNYWELRASLERERQRQYEQKQREDRDRRIREETLRRAQAQQTKRQEAASPQREAVKLPQTLEEALKLLHLTAPVTTDDIKRAYRMEAKKCHPDRGGSHAAMIRINAAYELALSTC